VSTMTAAPTNTQDKQWQADTKYPPDKSSKWTTPFEQDGWFHAHNAIRCEIKDLSDGIKTIIEKFPNGAPTWAISSIQIVWKDHQIHVHSHHSNEDDIMFPFLRTRINVPKKLEADHGTLLQYMENVNNIVIALKEGDTLERLQDSLFTYEEGMLPHLKEEEDIALPLMRAYFTPKEIGPKTQKIVDSSPDCELGSFIYYMTEHKFRSEFMKKEGIPSFVWFLVFKKKYQYFLNNLLIHYEALKIGNPPEESPVGSGGGCCVAS
jgi:iron-sulfur cluster repair protein YtfE (RIC family)